MADLDEERQSMVLNIFFFVMAENGCLKLYPITQGGPEIKYFLQGEISGK